MWTATACLVLASWVAIMAALTFVTTQPGLSVAVISRRGEGVEIAAAAGGRLVDAGDYVTIARSEEPGFILRLYRAGALLVLDARVVEGCRGAVRQIGSALRL
jgi:hypothetical protein